MLVLGIVLSFRMHCLYIAGCIVDVKQDLLSSRASVAHPAAIIKTPPDATLTLSHLHLHHKSRLDL